MMSHLKSTVLIAFIFGCMSASFGYGAWPPTEIQGLWRVTRFVEVEDRGELVHPDSDEPDHWLPAQMDVDAQAPYDDVKVEIAIPTYLILVNKYLVVVDTDPLAQTVATGKVVSSDPANKDQVFLHTPTVTVGLDGSTKQGVTKLPARFQLKPTGTLHGMIFVAPETWKFQAIRLDHDKAMLVISRLLNDPALDCSKRARNELDQFRQQNVQAPINK